AVHQRRGTRQRLQRAERSGGAAAAVRGAAHGPRHWRSRGARDGRGLHPRPGVRPAADGGRKRGHRSPRHAADEQSVDSRCDSVSVAAQARIGPPKGGHYRCGTTQRRLRPCRTAKPRGISESSRRGWGPRRHKKMDLPFELHIALRYLLAKRKQALISVISLVSTIGVTVGVMAVIIALAVMTGLQQTLRDRILGSQP